MAEQKVERGRTFPYIFTPYMNSNHVKNLLFTLRMISTGAEEHAKTITIQNPNKTQEEIKDYFDHRSQREPGENLFLLIYAQGSNIIGYIDFSIGVSEVLNLDGKVVYRYYYEEGSDVYSIRHVINNIQNIHNPSRQVNYTETVDIRDEKAVLQERSIYRVKAREEKGFTNWNIDSQRIDYCVFDSRGPVMIENTNFPQGNLLTKEIMTFKNVGESRQLNICEYTGSNHRSEVYMMRESTNVGINNNIVLSTVALRYISMSDSFTDFPMELSEIEMVVLNEPTIVFLEAGQSSLPVYSDQAPEGKIIEIQRHETAGGFRDPALPEIIQKQLNTRFSPILKAVIEENVQLDPSHKNSHINMINTLPLSAGGMVSPTQSWFRFLLRPGQSLHTRQIVRKTKLRQSRSEHDGVAGILYVNSPFYYWEELFLNANAGRHGTYLIFLKPPWYIFLGYVTYNDEGNLHGLSELLYPDGSLITQREYRDGILTLSIDHKTTYIPSSEENTDMIPFRRYMVTDYRNIIDSQVKMRVVHVEDVKVADNQEMITCIYHFNIYFNEFQNCTRLDSYDQGKVSRIFYEPFKNQQFIVFSRQEWDDGKNYIYIEYDDGKPYFIQGSNDQGRTLKSYEVEEYEENSTKIVYGFQFSGYRARLEHKKTSYRESFVLTPERQNIQNFNVIARTEEEDKKIIRRDIAPFVRNEPYFPNIRKPSANNPNSIVFGKEGGINSLVRFVPPSYTSEPVWDEDDEDDEEDRGEDQKLHNFEHSSENEITFSFLSDYTLVEEKEREEKEEKEEKKQRLPDWISREGEEKEDASTEIYHTQDSQASSSSHSSILQGVPHQNGGFFIHPDLLVNLPPPVSSSQSHHIGVGPPVGPGGAVQFNPNPAHVYEPNFEEYNPDEEDVGFNPFQNPEEDEEDVEPNPVQNPAHVYEPNFEEYNPEEDEEGPNPEEEFIQEQN